MMFRKVLADTLWTLTGVLLVSIFVWFGKSLNSSQNVERFRSKVKHFAAGVINSIEILRHNLISDFKPARPYKIAGLLVKETQLKSYMGGPFLKFTKKDWEFFWHLLYGYKRTKHSGRIIKEPYTQQEIEDSLCDNYELFCFFRPEHWNLVWNIALK